MTTQSVIEDARRTASWPGGGILAALAGRWGWRLWWPLVPYLATAAVTWLMLSSARRDSPYAWSESASGALLLGSVAAVAVLWLWGVRFALALGYGRTPVFVSALALSFVLPTALHAVSNLCNLAELAIVGPHGIRVFTLEGVGDSKFGSNQTFFNGLWVLLALFLVPVLSLLVLTCVAALRRGVLGALAGIGFGLLLVAVAGAVMWTGGVTGFELALLYLLVVPGSVGLAAWLFRGVRG